MAETTYRIIFSGEIAPGQHIDDVKRKFAALYKKDIATIERLMFTGKPVIVKKNLDQQTALKLKDSLITHTGGLFEVEPASPPPQDAHPESPPQASSQAQETPAADQEAVPAQSKSEPAKEEAVKQNTPSSESSISLDDRVGFWPRLAASLVDFDLLMLVSFPIGFFFGGLLGGLLGGLAGGSQNMGGAGLLAGSLGGMFVGLLVAGNLYNLIEGFSGASPGKMMIGVKITNADGSKASIGKLLLRYAVKNIAYLTSLVAGIIGIKLIGDIGAILGIVWILGCFLALGARRQALHDRMLDTAVYYRTTLQKKVPSDFPLKPKKDCTKEKKQRAKKQKAPKAPKPKLTLLQILLLGFKFLVGTLLGVILGIIAYHYAVIPYLVNRFVGP